MSAEHHVPSGTSHDNPTIDDLIAEYAAADAALAGCGEPDAEAGDRHLAAFLALRHAHPTEPGDIAKQLRWLLGQEDAFNFDEDKPLVERAAGVLERLGRLQPADDLPGSAWAHLEAALVKNHRRWTYRNAERCIIRRCELLAQAAALPIRSDADAAAALMIAMRMGDHDIDDEGAWVNTGPPEDAPRGEIARSVHRYLAGRASS